MSCRPLRLLSGLFLVTIIAACAAEPRPVVARLCESAASPAECTPGAHSTRLAAARAVSADTSDPGSAHVGTFALGAALMLF